MITDKSKLAFIDDKLQFKCPNCSEKHTRGAINGVNVFRCLKCGKQYRVKGIIEFPPLTEDKT